MSTTSETEHGNHILALLDWRLDQFFDGLDSYGKRVGLSDSELLLILQKEIGNVDLADCYHEWIWAGAEGAGEGSI